MHPVTLTAAEISTLERTARDESRDATSRRYIMCPPTYFAVTYAINPWMDPTVPVDQARVLEQWAALRATYEGLGHRVDVIDPEPDLPDMVFAANGAFVVDGTAMGAKFFWPERAGEAAAHAAFLRRAGVPVTMPEHVNEGEGDLLLVGRTVLAGTGFRTTPDAHREVQETLGLPVITLELADPRFYHLDTALAVLDERTVAYLPQAFSPGSQRVLRELFPDAVIATEADACVLGLNAVSDGRNVVLEARAETLAADLRRRGFNPVGVDMSELNKAGGGVKCCTLEVRP